MNRPTLDSCPINRFDSISSSSKNLEEERFSEPNPSARYLSINVNSSVIGRSTLDKACAADKISQREALSPLLDWIERNL